MEFKKNEKWYSTIKYGVLNKIYKMIVIHLHEDTIMNKFYFHGLYNCFYFLSQIDLMQFLKEFKVNEICIVQFIKVLLLFIKALRVHYNKTMSFNNTHLIIDF
jgi:hypothetical protein